MHAKLAVYESHGLAMLAFHIQVIVNHDKALQFYERIIDSYDNDRLIGAQLVKRFQDNRAHSWVPVPKSMNKEKRVSFCDVSSQFVLGSSESSPVQTHNPKKHVREFVTFFFSNITFWGPQAQNWLLSADVLNKYHV